MPDFDVEKFIKDNASLGTPVAPLNLKGVGDAMRPRSDVPSDGGNEILDKWAAKPGMTASPWLRGVINAVAAAAPGIREGSFLSGSSNTVASNTPKSTGVEAPAASIAPKTIGVPVRPWAPDTPAIKGVEAVPTVDRSIPIGATNINMTGGVKSYTTKGVDGGNVNNFVFEPAPGEEKGVYGRTVENTSWKEAQSAGDLSTGSAAENYMLGNRGVSGPDAFIQSLRDQGVSTKKIERLSRALSSLQAAQTGQTNAITQAKGVEQTGAYQQGMLANLEKEHGIKTGDLAIKLGELNLKKKAQEELLNNPKYLDLALKMSTEQTVNDMGDKTTNINFKKLPWAIEQAKNFHAGTPMKAYADEMPERPDAVKNAGRIIVDNATKKRFKSDGKTWQEMK
jgi:hypothetical protein